MPLPSTHPSRGVARSCALVLSALCLLAQGCRSPAEHRKDADRDVYSILQGLREDLAMDGSFGVDPLEDTLRTRLLEGEVEELVHLSLLECLQVAAENSRAYQTQREALYLRALDLTLERWNFSVQENGTLGAFLAGSGRNAESTGLLTDLGFTKLFTTGLSIVGGLSIDLVRDLGQGDGWDAVSNLSLSVTQPLLRGFGRLVVTEPLTQAERNVIYQARTYESFRRDLALDVANRYFRVLQLYDRLGNEEANFTRRSTLRERNEAFASAGQLTDVDVDQARQEELDARNRVVVAKRDLQATLDDFKFFLGLPIEVPLTLDPASRDELAAIEALTLDIPEETAVAIGLERRLDLQTSWDLVVDTARRIDVNENLLQAGLELNVQASMDSAEGRPADFSDSDTNWAGTLSFDAPFERLPERNRYRRALIAYQAAKRNAEQDADGVRADLRDSLRRLETARQSYEIQTGAVKLAERRVESSQLNLEAGRAETRDVLESQDALVRAQNNASLTLTEYLLASLDFYRGMELFLINEEGFYLDTAPLDRSAP